MTLAIILLNYNTSSDCRKCVSFLKQQQGVEQEIIIVDNCSQADDCNKVKMLCQEEGCTFIPATENRGYNAGNNIGLRYAASKGYKYAMIANPDMEFPQTDYIQKLATEMDNDNEIVVCGSDIISPEGIHQNPMKRDGDWRGSFDWITGLLKRKPTDTYDFIDNYHENHYCYKVSGCCLMVRMDFVKSIGFFDERVFLYCEEAILSRQTELAGKRMYYLGTAQAVHRHIKSEKGDPAKRFRQLKRSRIQYIKKYSGNTWWGKMIAISSVSIYAWLLGMACIIKKK